MIAAIMQLDLEMFREGGGRSWSFLLDPQFWAIVCAVIGSAAAVIAVADLMRRDRERSGPAMRLLARSIGLGTKETRLLANLAREGGFPSPACLMVSEGCFDRAAQQRDDPEIAHLRRRLFDPQEPVHFRT